MKVSDDGWGISRLCDPSKFPAVQWTSKLSCGCQVNESGPNVLVEKDNKPLIYHEEIK